MNLLKSTIGRRRRRQPAGTRDRFGAKLAEAYECGRQQGRREVIQEMAREAATD